ncbi:MAG TPA: hypothetical protein VJ814_07455 [Gaiellaceae bacterium]|nr:hypothetical protein [Gaiellaceae bacterium]
MPTRKQRRRTQKERRHEYETVWVDEEGNELEEPPEEAVSPAPSQKRNGAQPKAKAQPQRGGRPIRVPPPPSWQRAAKRSGILGAVIFAVFYILGSKNGGHDLGAALLLAGIYTLLFIPFTYMIDRFSHNRWLRRAEEQGQKGSARKR